MQQLWGKFSSHPIDSSRYQTPYYASIDRNNCCLEFSGKLGEKGEEIKKIQIRNSSDIK